MDSGCRLGLLALMIVKNLLDVASQRFSLPPVIILVLVQPRSIFEFIFIIHLLADLLLFLLILIDLQSPLTLLLLSTKKSKSPQIINHSKNTKIRLSLLIALMIGCVVLIVHHRLLKHQQVLHREAIFLNKKKAPTYRLWSSRSS